MPLQHFKRPMSRYVLTIPVGVLAGAVGAIAAYDGIAFFWSVTASLIGFAVAISENTDRNIVIAIDDGRVNY